MLRSPSLFWLLPAAIAALNLAVGCSPKAPAAAASDAPSAVASASAAPPIKAVSRGSDREPARYIVRDRSGHIVYDVRSSTVVYDRAADGSSVATFTDPHVVFHARNGTVAADSPKAVAHDKDKSVVMTGGVHAKTDDGKLLSCSTLTYDAQSQKIVCEGDVVLKNSKTNQTASGERLVTDPDFDHVVLSGGR